MKLLRLILLTSFGVTILLFTFILATYFIKFSGNISDNPDDWVLFISICNWGFISLLTGLNVWVFFKLTSLIAKKDEQHHIENKLSRSENAILDLRISDYKRLRYEASKIKIAILKKENFEYDLNLFMQVLYSMNYSSLFSTTTMGVSILAPIIEKFEKILATTKFNGEELMKLIDSSLSTIEVLIFTNQLRDERIWKQVQEHPNWFDSTLVSIDEYFKNMRLPAQK